MPEIITLKKHDEVYFKVHCTISQSMELKEYLSCKAPNFWFHPKFKARLWDGTISYFNIKNRLLPIGLLFKFLTFCKQFSYEYKFDFDVNSLSNNIDKEELISFAKIVLKGCKTSDNKKLFPYDFQLEAIHRLLTNKRGVIECPTGCHIKNTPILMSNGTYKNVEDIIIGDKIMGPDNKDRNVLNLFRGKEQMYKIIPNKGKQFIVNENHILHLRFTCDGYFTKKFGESINISVKDYIKQSNTFKHMTKLVYNNKKMIFKDRKFKNKISPYFMGLYLGDGHVYGCSVTTMDPECVTEIYKEAKKFGATVHDKDYYCKGKAKTYSLIGFRGSKNPLLEEFEKCGLYFSSKKKCIKKRISCETKFIPDSYKYGTIKSRYELLAGLIDSDGYLESSYYGFCSKSKTLMEDVSFVARSLGFFVTEKRSLNKKYNKYYFSCRICGDIFKIPVRIKRKKSQHIFKRNKRINYQGFKIEKYKVDNFYGFKLDGDGLYLFNDFQITHNSGKSLIIYLIIRFLITQNKRVCIIVPTTSLVEQMYSDFTSYGWKDIQKRCDKLYSGEKINFDKQILITTWQSVYKKTETFFKRFGGFIVDEVHSAKSISVQNVCKKCINAEYRMGTTGTLPEEPSDKYNIFGYIGPCVFEETSGELIDKGILSKITVANIMLRYPQSMIQDVKKMGYHEEVNAINGYVNRNSVLDFIFDNTPDKQNSLVLVKKIDHLKSVEEYLLENLPDKYSVYTIWGEIKPKEREGIRQLMEKDGNLILLATFATMGTGINIKRLHQVIFYSSYKSKIKVLQSLGRGLRKHKTKSRLILWDCIDDLRYKKKSGKFGENHVFKHFRERLRYYDDQGFDYVNKTFKI